MNVFYLFEANNTVGLGHCSRAVSLAKSLIKNGDNSLSNKKNLKRITSELDRIIKNIF